MPSPVHGLLRGYDATSYGRGFADVYDDWYADVTDVAATVDLVASLAPGGSVLELGVGTGRLALPMVAAGLSVTGIDSSADMLAVLADADPTGTVAAVEGDMVVDLPDGPFDVALVAYNTLFNLPDADAQRACFGAVASRLRPGGSFVVETIVADVDADEPDAGRRPVDAGVRVRSMSVDRVVLSVTQDDPAQQRAAGQFIEITEADGVRLRPWAIRWSTLDELDDMATGAGFELADRWADMRRSPFTDRSDQQVSVYVRGA